MTRDIFEKVLFGTEESSCRERTQNLAFRAGVQVRPQGKDMMLLMDGEEQVLCRNCTAARRWRVTWAEMRKRFPLLAGF
jgi:hypothetical protein